METITIGDKKIGIRTSVLEEKATACNMLCCYADELKEGFYPWIDQVKVTGILLLLWYSVLDFQSMFALWVSMNGLSFRSSINVVGTEVGVRILYEAYS